jgi:hypothetical protein
VRAHALVQRAVLEPLPSKVLTATVQAAADALLQTWPQVEPHANLARALQDNAQQLFDRHQPYLWSRHGHPVLFRAGTSLGSWGLLDACIDYWQQLATTAEHNLTADHPDTLTARHQLAKWRGWAGDYVGAATALEQLLADQLRVLGPEHSDTLATRHYLAMWRGEAGDLAGAIATIEQVFADLLRVLGPDHPDTLVARNNIAHFRGEAGDLTGAVTGYRQLLADELRLLGPDHPGTLTCRQGVAYYRGLAGDLTGAITAYEQLLADALRVYGPDHPQTLGVRNDLARLRGEPGTRQLRPVPSSSFSLTGCGCWGPTTLTPSTAERMPPTGGRRPGTLPVRSPHTSSC